MKPNQRDIGYLNERARQERLQAERSLDGRARAAHVQLAETYEQRLREAAAALGVPVA